jgi:DNA-binding NtrC family response regulator
MNPKLLIVDDDEEIRIQLKSALAKEFEIFLAADRPRALAIFNEQKPLVVLLDLGLPPHPGNPEEGLAALSDMLAQQQCAKIIIISGPGEKANALKAIGAGAYDFLSKPIDVEELKIILKRTFHVADLERDYRELQQSIARGPSHTTLRQARESSEREMVLRALNQSGGRIAPAASKLGISRPTLYELMEKLGIRRPERRRRPSSRISGASLDRA